MDITLYLPLYKITAKELAVKIMKDVFDTVGVRATCGIGTNLYLSKVALDITAKHADDFIGILDEETYKKTMWNHQPITDFWRIGKGTAKRLAERYIYTMGDITKVPEDSLYKWFGIDAELLIDHAWGKEPTTIRDIKNYKSKTNCLTSGQVLMRDYSFIEGEIIVKEMMETLCGEMLEKKLCTDSITMCVGYSNALKLDFARGSGAVSTKTNSDTLLIPAAVNIYHRIVNAKYPIRRINITCNRVTEDNGIIQMDIFENYFDSENKRKIQKTVLDIKKRFGKNSILKGISLQEAATARERNRQIGGHKSGE
ncbi:MAG: DNA repair protein [Clostridia bacterium]|nr:DNA repair protein [Clostridia bacterium]